MKKLLALLLALTMVLSLGACGNKTTTTEGDTNTGDTSTGDTGDTGTGSEGGAESTGLKVAMICDSSISDGGWGMSCYNAMVAAAEANGWETAYSDSIAQSAYYDTMSPTATWATT